MRAHEASMQLDRNVRMNDWTRELFFMVLDERSNVITHEPLDPQTSETCERRVQKPLGMKIEVRELESKVLSKII